MSLEETSLLFQKSLGLPVNSNQESTTGEYAENNKPWAAQLQMIHFQQNFYTYILGNIVEDSMKDCQTRGPI